MFNRISSLFSQTRSVQSRELAFPVVAVQVDDLFAQSEIQKGGCTWVDEAAVKLKEREGYTFYVHPENGKMCCRIARPGPRPVVEFLMILPKAARYA
jgi:hypothetical protein